MSNATLPGLPAPQPVPIGKCSQCEKAGVWSNDKHGDRCGDHVPVVHGRAIVRTERVSVIDIVCADCGHEGKSYNAAMIAAVKRKQTMHGQCKGCGVLHEVAESRLHVVGS